MPIRGTIMASWKGSSKRQKIQVAILYTIWVLFGLVIAVLRLSNVISQLEYGFGLIAWAVLAGIFAIVIWFIFRKKDSQQKTTVK